MSIAPPPLPVMETQAAPPGFAALRRFLLAQVWLLVALGLTLLFNALFTPGFFQLRWQDGHLFGQLVDIFNRGAPIMLVTLGMTFVMALRGVDLSVGAIMAISGTLLIGFFAQPEEFSLSLPFVRGSLAAAVLLALLGGLLAGGFNATLVSGLSVQPIIATLLLMVGGRGIAQLLSNGQILRLKDPQVFRLGAGFLAGIPVPVLIALTAFALAGLLARGTALGMFLEAAGNNPAAARLAGLPLRALQVGVYVFSGLCAALAGVLVAADIRCADSNNAGLYIELDAILAVVLGGTSLAGGRFSLAGSLLGVVLIQTLTTTVLSHNIDPALTQVLKAAVILAVCLLQSPSFRAKFRFRRTPA